MEFSPLLEGMTQFVLLSSFALTCTDCLQIFEKDETLGHLLRGVVRDAHVEWEKEYPAAEKRKQQIMVKMEEEGLLDEIELHFQCRNMNRIQHSYVSLVSTQIHYLGQNAPYLQSSRYPFLCPEYPCILTNSGYIRNWNLYLHGNSVPDLTSDNKSQLPKDNTFDQETQISVMFEVCNSTFRLDNLELFANTPCTAISLIRSSTFVITGSTITSCPDTSPFVIGDSGMESSVSVSIILCSHRSSSDSSSLLPLVSGHRSLLPSAHITSNEEQHADTFGVRSLSIVGSGLNLKSVHLVAGTGPLFDFGYSLGNRRSDVVGCTVSLSAATLTNTTSTRLPSTFPRSCSSLMQRLIRVSVTESTNHLCGTSGMPLDWSGSSLLSNCSFSSCLTNTAPEPIPEPTQDPGADKTLHTYSQQTERLDLSDELYDTTTRNQVWVISCAFEDLPSLSFGGAIRLSTRPADLVVKHSSFKGCSVEGSGGAMYVIQNPSAANANIFYLTLFNCQFTNNTAGITGGHVIVQAYNPVTVAQCTFEDSRSMSNTPLTQYQAVHVSLNGNCRFDNCTLSNNEGRYAGGIYIKQNVTTGSVILTDILFKENVCTNATASQRVTDCIIYQTAVQTLQFFDCFSTSAQPHCGSHCANPVYPDCIGPSITSVVQTTKFDEDGDEYYSLAFTGVFKGTNRKYDVTLEDGDGARVVIGRATFTKSTGSVTLPVSHPNSFSLSPSTKYFIVSLKKSVTQSTSNALDFEGETEPDWTWWHHTLESRADNLVGLSFTTPAASTLTKIEAELNPSNLNEGIITLTVDTIPAGSFTLIVFENSDAQQNPITIGPFLFTSSSTETSSSHTVVIHPSGKLSYGKTYTVKTLSSSTLIVSHSSPTFDVPDAPPRISFASPTLSGMNRTWVDVVLTGDALPQGKGFKIVVKEMEGDAIKSGAPEINLTGTIDGSSGTTTTCTARVEIYKKAQTLEYSTKYKIESLEINGYGCIVDSTVTFTVPASPCRIEGTEGFDLNGEKTGFYVTVKGVNFPSPMTSLTSMEVKGSVEISSTSIVRKSDSELRVEFGVGKAETSDLVEYGKSYTIAGVSGGLEVFVNSGVGLTVPSPGIVSSTSTELNSETNDAFKVIVNGKDFVIDSEWILKLTGRNEEISVRMTSTEKGESSWVKAEMNPANFDQVILTLTSTRMSAGSFTLIVFETDDAQKTPISIGPFAYSVSTEQIDSVFSLTVVPSGLLSCGETYTVHSLSSSSQIVSHSSQTFQVPPLIRTASASLNLDDLDEVIVSLTAFGFPSSTPIMLTIVEVDESDNHIGSPFELTGTPSKTGDSTHILKARVEPTKLEHATRFEITKCDVVGQETVLDGRVFFHVPSKPDFSVLHISSTGNDENDGTATDPLLTLHSALGKCDTALKEDWLVEMSDWCRIGKQTELGAEQEGLRVVVKGGEGRRIDCTLTESEPTVGHRGNKEQGMVSVSKNTLSFVEVMFVVASQNERIGSVLRVGEGGVVWMEGCEVRSSETMKQTFIAVCRDGEMKGEGLKISSMKFVGKGCVVRMSEKGRLTLSSCSFDGVSFESGGVVVGKTRGKIWIDETRFTWCSGRSFGSVIRVMTVGGEMIVTKCDFVDCSTTVDLNEHGRVELGGGCVLVEMEQTGRSLSSCRVDLRKSSFLGCTLRWIGQGREGAEVVGGSGFMIVGRRVKGVVLLDGVRLSSCSCVGDGASGVISGGPRLHCLPDLSLLPRALSSPSLYQFYFNLSSLRRKPPLLYTRPATSRRVSPVHSSLPDRFSTLRRPPTTLQAALCLRPSLPHRPSASVPFVH
ncbi:hypothetical protein BLNAU_16933 [Blattamonas nauphoetae]|uniref:Uncharacterized protein n=1 Tax=Blattamonas nauphoetae TaxID=2049346 RepID=A0ABQ9X823_9EUKA|nr:hypothetical protein BLNAU_16933 [Blattamonas nauphoetae]